MRNNSAIGKYLCYGSDVSNHHVNNEARQHDDLTEG